MCPTRGKRRRKSGAFYNRVASWLLSVPHLSRLHDLPHDYYRYTHIGLRHLLTQAGFEIVELQTKGGLFTFLGHQFSSVILSLAWGLPSLRPLVWSMNKWLVTLACYQLDRLTGNASTFPLGYVVVARKPDETT